MMVGEKEFGGSMPPLDMVGSSFGGVACDAVVAMDMLPRVCGSGRLYGRYSRSSAIC
jgi:hypothetical protein